MRLHLDVEGQVLRTLRLDDHAVLVEDQQIETCAAADRTSIAYRRLLKEMGLGALYLS